MKKQRILFIGAGRMAEAVAAGLVTSSADSIEAVVMSNNGDIERLQRVETTYGVHDAKLVPRS